LDQAERDVAARSGEYDAALAAAQSAARGEAERFAADAARAAQTVRGTLAQSLAAHYPFESARPAALADLPPPRPPRIPPADLTEFRRNAYSPPPVANETAEQRR